MSEDVKKYEERYNQLIKEGKDKEEAQEIALAECFPEESTALDESITLRKHFSMKDLEKLEYVQTLGGWSKMTLEEKDYLLWLLGLDVKGFGFGEKIGKHSTASGKIVEGLYVYGQERCDEDWLSQEINGQKVASFAAQVRGSDDPTLEAELRRLGGSI